MRSITSFNDGWVFRPGFLPTAPAAPIAGTPVRLPHTAVELPFSYFDEKTYQRPFTYQKSFKPDPAWAGRDVTILFDGAMADSEVYLNGQRVLSHRDGYTPFAVRLNGGLLEGDNLLTVKVDGSENPEIPPFGGRIDYLTYAGLYRDAWVRVTAPVAIGSVKIETPDALAAHKQVAVRIWLSNPEGLAFAGTLTATVRDASGTGIATQSVPVVGDTVALDFRGLAGVSLWDIDQPVLHTLELELETPHGIDRTETSFGFRSAAFTPEGFFLNGRPLKLRGLNRHQSFPYAGYALGREAQERDAEILKNELKLNIVRTSHYPQSPWFLDHCDRIGLLVFEEIPGWQHIGGADWKAEAVRNVRRMIERDWNHPSIVLWGVRINESLDDHDFYTETNRPARELDSTRQTGGVRYLAESELLEDVYTVNDFILGSEEFGGNRPRTALRPVAEVTGLDRTVPYLVTEYGGHMYPTKSTDEEQRQVEHVLRHLEVLDAAYADPGISGAIGWCAFDYNTHKDFGSGDRICHHGVTDMFREPKFAAFAYASQCDPSEGAVLKPVTFWARGERNIGGILPLVVLTNCEEVELRYGENAPKRLTPARERFPHLPHAPVIFERRHFSASELGQWGMEWKGGTIVGYIGGKAVTQARFVADPLATTLEVAPDRIRLREGGTTRVIVRALDQVGNKLPYFPEPVQIAVTGQGRLIGPHLVPLRAGSTGFWIEALQCGGIEVAVSSPVLGTTRISLAVEEAASA